MKSDLRYDLEILLSITEKTGERMKYFREHLVDMKFKSNDEETPRIIRSVLENSHASLGGIELECNLLANTIRGLLNRR